MSGSFDLEKLHCENEFDRDFTPGAVDKWYGRRHTFTDLVRGPLCEELLSMLPWSILLLGVYGNVIHLVPCGCY